MDDQRIIDLYFSRSESAIQETQAKYAKLCRGIALNILGDELEAEECVNDVYLSLWNAIPPQRPDNLAAFICKVARNISLKRARFDHAAKRSARAVVSLSELENALPDSSLPSMEEEKLGKRISAFCGRKSRTPGTCSSASIGSSIPFLQLPTGIPSTRARSSPCCITPAKGCGTI